LTPWGKLKSTGERTTPESASVGKCTAKIEHKIRKQATIKQRRHGDGTVWT